MELIWTSLGLSKIVNIVVHKLYFLDPISVEYIPFCSCESNNIAQTAHTRTILLSLFFPKVVMFCNSFHKKVKKFFRKLGVFQSLAIQKNLKEILMKKVCTSFYPWSMYSVDGVLQIVGCVYQMRQGCHRFSSLSKFSEEPTKFIKNPKRFCDLCHTTNVQGFRSKKL